MLPSQAKPSQAKPSQAKPSQAKPSQAKPSQAKPSQANSNSSKNCFPPVLTQTEISLSTDYKPKLRHRPTSDANFTK
ncbi:hypothetical protein [Neisseria meningitidis]|uniref:hypothetical protein n=1 Tax=Neisseria meningitidis TaxID=487 RepID=UPI0018653532|nr:hypothetical protein [Neisseria meningitidis]